MSISTKNIERISRKYNVPITLAPESSDTLQVGTASMVTFSMIAAELAWTSELSGLKMVMAGDR